MPRIYGRRSFSVLAGPQEAQDWLRQAIAVAQDQGAKLWAVRARTRLSGMHQTQGRNKGPRQQVAELYAWFTQGYETEESPSQ